jgi:hypothetical protein
MPAALWTSHETPPSQIKRGISILGCGESPLVTQTLELATLPIKKIRRDAGAHHSIDRAVYVASMLQGAAVAYLEPLKMLSIMLQF